MFYVTQTVFIVLLFTPSGIVQQVSSIDGPKEIEGYIGGNVTFMWNTTDQEEILSVSWGIRNGNIADPQFINVNNYTRKANINMDLDETLRKRVVFLGDLQKGRAWFVLMNLTVNDTNEYIASISDDITSVKSYYVRLKVTVERKVIPTIGPPGTTKSPGTPGYNKTTTSPNITTPEPSSVIPAQHVNGLLIGYCIGHVVMWHL